MSKVSWFRVVLDLLVILILVILSQVVFQVVPPYHAGFYCTDQTVNLPFRSSTVTSVVLGVITTISPLVFVLGTELIRFILIKYNSRNEKNTSRKPITYPINLCCLATRQIPETLGNTYNNLTFYYLGLLATNSLTNMIKLIIGKLRPNFLAVCRPIVNPFVQVCNSASVWYVVPGVDFECGNSDVKEVDGSRKSFPSGHASLVFYAMVFLVLFIYRTWNCHHIGFAKHLTQFGLLSLAFFTASSRVQDNKHHAVDVIAGALLGTGIAIGTYWLLRKVIEKNDYKVEYDRVDKNDVDNEMS